MEVWEVVPYIRVAKLGFDVINSINIFQNTGLSRSFLLFIESGFSSVIGGPTLIIFMAINIYQENPEFILGKEGGGSFISFQEDHNGKIIINTEFADEKTELKKEEWIVLRQFLDIAFWDENEE